MGKRWSSVSPWSVALKCSVQWAGDGWALTKWAAVVHSWFLLPADRNKKSHPSKKQIAGLAYPGPVPQPFGQPWALFMKNYGKLFLGLPCCFFCVGAAQKLVAPPEFLGNIFPPCGAVWPFGILPAWMPLIKPLLPKEWSTSRNTGNVQEQEPGEREL